MPPMDKQKKAQEAAKQKTKVKIVEDKTFGLKNMNIRARSRTTSSNSKSPQERAPRRGPHPRSSASRRRSSKRSRRRSSRASLPLPSSNRSSRRASTRNPSCASFTGPESARKGSSASTAMTWPSSARRRRSTCSLTGERERSTARKRKGWRIGTKFSFLFLSLLLSPSLSFFPSHRSSFVAINLLLRSSLSLAFQNLSKNAPKC